MTFPFLEHLHHACIITGPVPASLAWVQSSLAEQGVVCEGNPDVLLLSGEQFLTPTLEPLQEYLAHKKIGNHRYVLLAFESISSEVQNKLLKVFEEPQEGTHILMLVPDIEKVIPTIQSRGQHIIFAGNYQDPAKLSVVSFLSVSLVERCELIESWVKNKKEEDNALKSDLHRFCHDLEKELWDCRAQIAPADMSIEDLFSEIRTIRNMLSVRGISHRILLDYLAFICPRV